MTPPVRVLHVVGQMNRAGTETWLMNMMRRIDRRRFAFDFLVHIPAAGEFDDEIRSLGGATISGPDPSQPWRYWRELEHVLHSHGPYDVVHSHVHRFSGYPLLVARRAGVPVRIAHSHTASDPAATPSRGPRSLYPALSSRLIAAAATDRVACSPLAAGALFGQEARGVHVIPCGVDTRPFASRAAASVIRRELGVPGDALVIGHVGRFVGAKNHAFLVDVFQRLSRDPRLHLLLAGDGPLRAGVEADVIARGLASRVTFTGSCADVARVMSAMDVFLFPSIVEGLGLVLVEAQAAGLPCIASAAVPATAQVVAGLVTFLPLSSADAWADATLRQLSAPRRNAWPDSLSAVEASAFSLDQSIRSFTTLYDRARALGAHRADCAHSGRLAGHVPAK
jgi:glycosyltransferase involved in cell wall biosynthesis